MARLYRDWPSTGVLADLMSVGLLRVRTCVGYDFTISCWLFHYVNVDWREEQRLSSDVSQRMPSLWYGDVHAITSDTRTVESVHMVGGSDWKLITKQFLHF